MSVARDQQGMVLVSALILILWAVFSAHAMSWVACYASYPVFQEKVRFVGLGALGSTALIGWVISHLRDLRKQVKEEKLALSRREVAEVNHLISLGYKKSVGMFWVSATSGFFFSFSVFFDATSPSFEYFVLTCGVLVGLILAFTVIAAMNLYEINRFEEKLSNLEKRKQSSASALKEFQGKSKD